MFIKKTAMMLLTSYDVSRHLNDTATLTNASRGNS